MKSFKRALSLSLSLLTVIALLFPLASCKPTSTPSQTTDSTTSGTQPPETPPSEIEMPTLLCDYYDTVNIDKVSTTPTFSPSLSSPEDSARSVIIPHFSVDSHMVLQRRAVNLIRGRTSDSHIAVSFMGELYYGVVDGGYFEVHLPPFEAAESLELIIISDSARLTLTDICIGEVFLLGGQSNMVWALGWSGDIHADDIAGANDENIRIMRLNHTESSYEMSAPEGDVSWERINPQAAKSFSAVGYLFGKQISETLEVPVGLVQAAVSGSSLAFWLPRDAYNEYTASGKNAYFSSASGNTMPCLGYNGMISPLIGMRFRGMLWYQGETNTQDSEYYFDQLSLLIETYRENFNAPTMCVTVIELAKSTSDRAPKWEPIKAAQWRASQELSNVAYSCSIDLGYHVDVHPKDKTMYAKRAADSTLSKFFGIETAPFPQVIDAERIDGNMVELTLDGGDGFELRNGTNGIEISEDGINFVQASAAAIDGNKLTVMGNIPINYLRYGVIYYDGETDFSKHVTVYNSEGNPLDQFRLKLD